jgi:hypothetical protein
LESASKVARRLELIYPCFGAKKKVKINIKVNMETIIPPVAPSRK